MDRIHRIQECSDQSIRKGCAYGTLAIGMTMLAMSSDLHLAIKFGAIGISLMVAILIIKALRAPRRNYKSTETWLLMGQKHDLPEPRAQQVIGNVLRDRYLWHAEITAIGALVMWVLTFALRFTRTANFA